MTQTFSNRLGSEERPLRGPRWWLWAAVGSIGVACLGSPAGRGHAADERSTFTQADSKEPRSAAVVDAGVQLKPSPIWLSLDWLAEHQMPDGGWTFDHTRAPKCRGQCGDPGELAEARNAATGLALLALLSAGQTHTAGQYKKQVKAGLYFLINKMEFTPHGGNLLENGGTMYSHGICTIALGEAYSMTRDKGLHAPAQRAIDFIVYAQDPAGGGWRYMPRQKGDTSVTGWQLTALKSGMMGGLRVPPATLQKASQFLDSLQADGGAQYGYLKPQTDQGATTAIGLLMRVYSGWEKDHPALQRGVRWLSERGPSKTNMYYNYYGQRLMLKMGGEEWTKWNDKMRDYLLPAQSQEGHQTGSWYFADGDHGASRGGRLYCTAMATMILEVYYRHLPIYRVLTPEEEPPGPKSSSSENGVLPIPGVTSEDECEPAKPWSAYSRSIR